jgi:hypothetical protein
MRKAIIPAILAAALTGTAATAAPIVPFGDVATPLETVQWRGGFRYDHPLMYPGNWYRHQRQWDAFEGRGAHSRAISCARFRAYDRRSHTYVNRSGRRVRCP